MTRLVLVVCAILPGGGDWIYDDAFVLTTSIE